MAITQKVVPWQVGYNYGVGVDFVSGSPMSLVVTGEQKSPGAGGTGMFSVTQIKSTSDLEQQLGIDVSASYGSAAFGAGVAARFNFAKNSAVQTSSLFMAVTATVQLDFPSIDAPALTADAASLVPRQDVFSQRYGNVFVRAVRRGGLFVGVMQIETKHTNDANDISTSLQGSYGLFSGSATGKFKSVVDQYSASVNVSIYHEGGPLELKIDNPADPMELLNAVNDFLKAFQTTPDSVATPYQVTLAPITIAAGPLPPNAAQLEHAEDVLCFCARQRSALLDQMNLMQYFASNPGKFDLPKNTDASTFQKIATDTSSDLDVIAQCASAAIDDPDNAIFPADYAKSRGITFPKAVMPDPLPTLKLAPPPPPPLVTVPDWGGQRDIDEGGNSMQGVHTPSADEVGLIADVQYTDTGPFNMGDVVSMMPPAGKLVPAGSHVTVVIQRNPGPHDQD